MFRLKAYWIYLFLVAKFAGMVCSSKAEHIIRRGPVSDPHCMSPLTNSKDEFPDSAFSASSVLQNRTEFQPYQARMTEVYGSKEHTSGHAWCPDSPSEDSLREWIQAEFSELVYVRAIYTAGRGDGNVKEFMPNFVLKYQREDGGAWYEHQKRDGSRILKANSDPRNLARATLETTVIAKRIRIYPFSRKASQQVCLRFSLYGCKFPDGVVSYSIPQGGIISRDRSYLPASDDPVTSISENFKDLSYDGQLIGSTNQLTDGLGQLMDNVAYFENVTTPSDMYPAQPGFHFVGWYQPGQTDVQILFKFDRIRKFTWLRLFTYDSIQLRARLISRATISFSMDGVNYGNSIEIPTGRAQLSDFGGSRTNSDQMSSVRLKRSRTATPVRQDPRIYTSTNWDGTAVLELDLNNRVGRFVKVTLTTTDSWILLSEVQFNSTIATDIPPHTVGKSAADKEPVLLVQGEGTPVADPKREVGAKVRPMDTPLLANEQAGDSRAGVFQGDTTPRDSISPMRDREADKNEFGSSSPGLSIIMPFIIAIVILIFALPTIVLIWICSRKRCRRSRSGCHRKVLLADGGRSGPMGGMHHLGDGTNSMTVQEATKLLNSYSTIPSSLRPDGTIVIPTQVCLANGTHASTTNVTHVTSNGLGGLGGATVSPLAYPPPPPAPPPPPGVGVILPCSPSSSSSSHTNGDNQAAVPAVSNIAPSLQPNSFLTAANPDGSNMYSGTEGSCMSGGGGGGMVSLSAQPTNMQPTCFVPAFIALPTSSPAGAFILQPVGFGQPPQLFGRLPPGGQASFGTPDSGSLYTSIRTSAQQLEQPTSVISVEGESERDTKGGVKQQGCNKTHGQPGRLEGEDTDEDVTELHEEVADHTRVEEEEKHKGNDEAPGAWIRNSHKNAGKGNAEYRPDRRIQCGKKNEGNAPKDESDQKSSVLKFAGISPDNKISGEVDNYLEPSDYLSKLIAGPRSGRNDRPRHRPISQQFPTSISRSSRRDSGLSLPDGEESQPYCNLLLSHGPSKQGIPVRIIRQTPAGLIVQPCGTFPNNIDAERLAESRSNLPSKSLIMP
ncbi:unnamed protein product [Calicophoron daubneyi]|uniref:F5/8 type C domain-containing protein n=1 Tax=Calicophoron daubneyi TaxID=300641 RepID=A0AAV2TGE7_CALDB